MSNIKDLNLIDSVTGADLLKVGEGKGTVILEENHPLVRGYVDMEVTDMKGNVLFTERKENKTLIKGAIEIAQTLCDLPLPIQTHLLDDAIGIAKHASTSTKPPVLFGIIVSVDGSTGVGSTTPVMRKDKGFDLASIVPFRITDVTSTGATDSDDESNLRDTYGLRHEVGNDAFYYAKKFDTMKFTARTVSGKVLPDFPELASHGITEDVEAVIEMTVVLEVEDCRTYFERSTGIDSRNISSVSLLRGMPYNPTHLPSKVDYTDVFVANRLNFPILNIGSQGAINIKYTLVIK